MSIFTRDLIERAAITGVESFIGALIVTELTDKSMWLAALVAGVSAFLSAVKSSVASRYGTGSASLSNKV